jgi:Arc/MetJ family transcription regulator
MPGAICNDVISVAQMRTTLDIDPMLLGEARQLSGTATNKQIIEEALRLWVKLQRQRQVDEAFGKYHWRGNLPQSRKGRGPAVKSG